MLNATPTVTHWSTAEVVVLTEATLGMDVMWSRYGADHEPWTYVTDYYAERVILPNLDLDEPLLVLTTGPYPAVASR